MIRYIFLTAFIFSFFFSFAQDRLQLPTPIWINEYSIQILDVAKIGDTIDYEKSAVERFKLVFFDPKGKCYFEKYVNNKLAEKGYYENSLDTLKKYVSGRNSNGTTSPIRVQLYFQPLKNGVWLTYKNNQKKKQVYIMGIPIEHTIPHVIRGRQ